MNVFTSLAIPFEAQRRGRLRKRPYHFNLKVFRGRSPCSQLRLKETLSKWAQALQVISSMLGGCTEEEEEEEEAIADVCLVSLNSR